MTTASSLKKYRIARGLILVWVLLLSSVWATPVQAGGVVGNGTPGSCTEVAFDAKLAGGGAVTFNCGAAPHTIVFSANKFVAANTTIQGGGLITFSGNNTTSLFQVFNGQTLTLNNVTLTHGRGVYGAIQNFGSLNVTHSRIISNTATSENAAGGISNYGDAQIVDTTISENSAFNGGGIYNDSGTITLTNSVLSYNVLVTSTVEARGGGVFNNTGQFTMIGGSVTGNRTAATHFAIFAGGGLYNNAGVINLTGVQVSNNVAGSGGGISNNDGTLTLRHTDVISNSSGVTGGSIGSGGSSAVTSIINSRIKHNASGTGGGIYLANNGVALITQTRVTSNTAVGLGGGVRNFTPSAVYLFQSLVDHNAATSGAGLANRGYAFVENSTFGGNVASNQGAAMLSEQSASTLELRSVTINENRAAFGSVYTSATVGQALKMRNTLIANTRDPNSGALNANCGLVSNIDEGGNYASDSTCLLAVNPPADPLLGPLVSAGGPTLVHLPQAGSVAIDGGVNTECPSADQRGAPRPLNGTCDSGAVEIGVTLPIVYVPLIIR